MATQENKTILKVEGMTCNHCKMSVEKFVGRIDGVKSVTATPNENKVEIEGDADIKAIKETIEKLGYRVG